MCANTGNRGADQYTEIAKYHAISIHECSIRWKWLMRCTLNMAIFQSHCHFVSGVHDCIMNKTAGLFSILLIRSRYGTMQYTWQFSNYSYPDWSILLTQCSPVDVLKHIITWCLTKVETWCVCMVQWINSEITYRFQRAVEMDCFHFALPKKEVLVQKLAWKIKSGPPKVGRLCISVVV